MTKAQKPGKPETIVDACAVFTEGMAGAIRPIVNVVTAVVNRLAGCIKRAHPDMEIGH